MTQVRMASPTRPVLAASAALVGCFGVSGVPGSAYAQPAATNPAPVCMARTAGDGSVLSIILPARDAQGLMAKGFVAVPCEIAFPTEQQREEWKDAICTIASEWREELQEHFERERGERPAVLCGMAEAAVAPWERGGGQQ